MGARGWRERGAVRVAVVAAAVSAWGVAARRTACHVAEKKERKSTTARSRREKADALLAVGGTKTKSMCPNDTTCTQCLDVRA